MLFADLLGMGLLTFFYGILNCNYLQAEGHMFFRDLHLSEEPTAPYYCEYSLTKSLHYWNKGFLPHFMDVNQKSFGKKDYKR